MMKIHELLLVWCICLTRIMFSQNPGYMGKKFVLGYGASASTALIGSNGQGNSIFGRANGNANSGVLAFNFHQEGFVEYAISKRMMIGFSVRYCKTSYDNFWNVYGEDVTYVNANGYEQTDNATGDLHGMYGIKLTNYTAYGKFFFKGYVAPWGKYLIFGPAIKRYTCTYNPEEMYIAYKSRFYPYDQKKFSDFGPQQQTYTRFDFLFGIGKARVIHKRFILDYGFNLHMGAFAVSLIDMVDEGLRDNGLFADRYVKKTATWRVRGVNRFNVFLKFGILLF